MDKQLLSAAAIYLVVIAGSFVYGFLNQGIPMLVLALTASIIAAIAAVYILAWRKQMDELREEKPDLF